MVVRIEMFSNKMLLKEIQFVLYMNTVKPIKLQAFVCKAGYSS